MKQQLVAVVIGAMLGFLMPYGAKVRGMVTRSRRMTSALKSELTEIVREMAEKIEWVERDVSRCLDEIDQSKVVRTKGGKMLFLGENEEFVILRGDWKNKYTEIAETIKRDDYAKFFRMYRLVDAFEQKFIDMKQTFDTEYGKLEVMALVCLDDLKKIKTRLDNELTNM